jgi:hypothetical protein
MVWLQLAGAVLLAVGAFLLVPWLGVMTAGAMLLGFGWLAERAKVRSAHGSGSPSVGT